MNGLVATLALSMSMLGSVDSAGRWSNDYAQAFARARRAGRPLLVVLEIPGQPRQQVAQVSYTGDPMLDDLLAPYILCRVDVTTRYGQRVAEAFGAQQFPYTAITDRFCQRLVYQKAGQFTTGEWIAVLSAHDPTAPPPAQLEPGIVFPGEAACFT